MSAASYVCVKWQSFETLVKGIVNTRCWNVLKANLDAADAAHAATHKLNCIKRVLRHLESESRGSRRNKRSNAQIKLYKEGCLL